jgi:hypothetical protein
VARDRATVSTVSAAEQIATAVASRSSPSAADEEALSGGRESGRVARAQHGDRRGDRGSAVRVAGEVDVFPAQCADFLGPCAGQQGEHDVGVQGRVLGGGEEGFGLGQAGLLAYLRQRQELRNTRP